MWNSFPLYQLPIFLSDSQNDTVTADFDPGSSLDSRLRGNDGETPITVSLQGAVHRTAKRTLFLAIAVYGLNLDQKAVRLQGGGVVIWECRE
jgi:hypothetical protein